MLHVDPLPECRSSLPHLPHSASAVHQRQSWRTHSDGQIPETDPVLTSSGKYKGGEHISLEFLCACFNYGSKKCYTSHIFHKTTIWGRYYYHCSSSKKIAAHFFNPLLSSNATDFHILLPKVRLLSFLDVSLPSYSHGCQHRQALFVPHLHPDHSTTVSFSGPEFPFSNPFYTPPLAFQRHTFVGHSWIPCIGQKVLPQRAGAHLSLSHSDTSLASSISTPDNCWWTDLPVTQCII